MRYLLLAITLVYLLGFTSMTTKPLSSPQVINETGSYQHKRSGFVFPNAVGPFQRGKLIRYDEDGLDVSAGYDLAALGGGVAATVYIYPSPPITSIGSGPEVVATTRALASEREFSGIKQTILQVHPDAAIIHSGQTDIQQGGTSYKGNVTEFKFSGVFAGRPQLLRSRLYIFTYIDGKWTVKYRFTYPDRIDASGTIEAFQKALTWPF